MPTTEPSQEHLNGAAVRAMRTGANLSIRALAKASGVHHSHLAHFERGERTISDDLMGRIQRVLASHLPGGAS